MTIDNEFLELLKNKFVPLYNKFNNDVKTGEFSPSERNGILYSVIIDIIENAMDKFSTKTNDHDLIMEKRKEILYVLLDKWKELDPQLEIDNDVIEIADKIRKHS